MSSGWALPDRQPLLAKNRPGSSSVCPLYDRRLLEKSGGKAACNASRWPAIDPSLIETKMITVSVQVNGKLRDYWRSIQTSRSNP